MIIERKRNQKKISGKRLKKVIFRTFILFPCMTGEFTLWSVSHSKKNNVSCGHIVMARYISCGHTVSNFELDIDVCHKNTFD